ncbi:Hypothetical protein, putative [Bodo saltans]|uniref:Uncharacterized protein n=1 Tax=Bodo saltans TaxID=75058 RepID=A0A0S4JJQ9_BODSA|nr:Hypothetical protein, putative [Bodo saltans]|eukprot:CUG89645.1 Hypothetical protein, putative [Bodo saltans]
MDSEFASRIASLERSIGAVSSDRERYLSSAVSSAFTRGAHQQQNSGGGGFRVTFPSNGSSGGVGTSFASSNATDDNRNPNNKHYDPSAVAQHSSLRNQRPGAASSHQTPPDYGLQQPSYAAASVAATQHLYEAAPFMHSQQQHYGANDFVVVDPYSEAFSVCPRCAHLSKLEESLSAVDDQYRAELEHLRKMVAQVDADRLDVVQRLKSSHDDVEVLRSQVLEKERQSSEWRQRAVVAEEELSAAQRVHSSAQWEWERRVVFALETMMYALATTETDARLNLVACEQASRSALWSVADAGQLELRRHKQIEKLRKEQERLATKTLTMHEAEAEYRRAMDEAILSGHQQQQRGGGMEANSGGGGGRPRAVLTAVSSTLSSALLTQSRNVMSVDPPNSRSNSLHPNTKKAAPQQQPAAAVVAPQLLHRCLSDPHLPIGAELEALDDRDSNSPELAAVLAAKDDEEAAARQRFTDDVSFGDLELEEDDTLGVSNLKPSLLLGVAGGAGGSESKPSATSNNDNAGNLTSISPSSELQRWQKLLAESDNARRQLEGHLLTEQHFSNELQFEVDDLSRRDEESTEAYRRAKMEISELQFRLELALQSHRRLEHRVAALMTSSSSSPLSASTATASPPSQQDDVLLLEKELKVLRQLYTAAKEDSIAARKELQNIELSRKESFLSGVTAPPALHKTLRPDEQVDDDDEHPLGKMVTSFVVPTSTLANSTAAPSGVTTVVPPVAIAAPPPTAKMIAEEVLRMLSPQFSLMSDSLAHITKQLSVSDDFLVPALSGGSKDHGGIDNSTKDEGGAPTLESVMETSPLAAPSATTTRKQPQSSFASLLLERVQNAAQAHQSAVRNMLESSMHGTDVRITELSEQIRSSLRPTPNVSLMETSTTIPVGGDRGTHHGGGGVAGLATSLGSVTPVDYLSQNSTPRVLVPALPPPQQQQGSGGNSSRDQSQIIIPHSLSSPLAPGGQAPQQQNDPVALSKLQDAIASMRNIMRNVLFSTSHNQKLIGEKLDDLTIGQRALMNEWNTTAASLLDSSQRHALQLSAFSPPHSGSGSHGGQSAVMMGSPTYVSPTDSVNMGSPTMQHHHHGSGSQNTGPSPILQHNGHSFRQNGGGGSVQQQQQQLMPSIAAAQNESNNNTATSAVQYSVPPALQQKALAALAAQNAAVNRPPPQALHPTHLQNITDQQHQEATHVIDQFVLEEAQQQQQLFQQQQQYHPGSGGHYVTSPAAPPLPQFSKVTSTPAQQHHIQQQQQYYQQQQHGVAVPPSAVIVVPSQHLGGAQHVHRSGSPAHSGDRSSSPGGGGGSSGSGLPPLQRRASHRWDEDEDDEGSPVVPVSRATSSVAPAAAVAQRSWKKVKNPYSDSD